MRGGFEEVCDASEQQETALKTLESASTFASTLAFSRSSDINNTIVFTGVIASDSDAMPVFRLVCGTSVQKLLILKGIIELEAEVGIEPTDGAFAEPCLTTWLLRRSNQADFREASSKGASFVHGFHLTFATQIPILLIGEAQRYFGGGYFPSCFRKISAWTRATSPM